MSAATKPRRGRGDGSVYRDEATGRWIGLLDLGRDERGKRQRKKVSAATKSDATKRLREVQRRYEAGLDTRKLTVEQVIREWLAKAAPSRREPSTLARLTRRLEDHVIPGVGHHRVDALRAEHVEAWLLAEATKGERGQSRRTIEDYRGDLRQVLNWARRRRLVDWNAAAEAEIPVEARTPGEKRTLDDDQAAALLAELRDGDDRLGPYFTVLLLLGMRPGEADALAWSDVDLEDGILDVKHALQRGDDGKPIGIADTKTHRQRALRMPAAVIAAFRAQRVQQAAEKLRAGTAWTADERWSGLVFVSEVGTPMNPSNVRRSFSAICNEIGLPKIQPDPKAKPRTLTPYELRHSAASLLIAAGVAPFEVADMLGHRDLRMLERFYRHRTVPVVSGHAGVMDRIAGGA